MESLDAVDVAVTAATARGELVVDDVADEIGLHSEVLVDDDVAQSCDRSPRSSGMDRSP
jgi:hypothetical protein